MIAAISDDLLDIVRDGLGLNEEGIMRKLESNQHESG